MAEMLVENSLGTPLRFEPEQDQLHSMLTGIAIHFVSVLFCKPRHEVLRVFYALLQDPSSLKVHSQIRYILYAVYQVPMSHTVQVCKCIQLFKPVLA